MNFKRIFNTAFVALGATFALSLSSCSDDVPNYWDDYYGKPEVPEPGDNAKPRYIWIDAAANFPYVANDKDEIARYVARAKEAGFTDILVDVRPTNGDVLFKTDLVDQVKGLWQWKKSTYGYTERTATWDYLQAFIDAGHEAGLRVHAAMNTMVGGNTAGGGMGMVYRDPSKRDMVTTLNLPGMLTNMLESGLTGEMFLNPHHPKVQELIVGLVRDVAKYSDLDGIVLDRGRFLDMRSDFSDITREQFEKFIGTKLDNWPGDVLPAGADTPPSNPPTYYKQWWEFRAQTIHDLIEKAAEAAHETHPGIQFGCYVGAWYGSYYQNGVNWASPDYDPVLMQSNASWCSNTYKNTGYADMIDILILGCYAKPWAVYGTNDWTVEGFALNGMTRTAGACPLVIGGPDFGSWPTETKNYLFDDQTYDADFYYTAAMNSVDACINACDGYFLFDIIHLQNSPDYWDYVKAGIDRYLGIENELIPTK